MLRYVRLDYRIPIPYSFSENSAKPRAETIISNDCCHGFTNNIIFNKNRVNREYISNSIFASQNYTIYIL